MVLLENKQHYFDLFSLHSRKLELTRPVGYSQRRLVDIRCRSSDPYSSVEFQSFGPFLTIKCGFILIIEIIPYHRPSQVEEVHSSRSIFPASPQIWCLRRRLHLTQFLAMPKSLWQAIEAW